MNIIDLRNIERTHYIYKWTNLVNNKIYIGMTVNPRQRIAQYKNSAKYDSQDVIHRALRKHGFHNFTYELIAFFDNFYIANDAEIFYISLFNSRDRSIGYNVAAGGCRFVDSEIGKLISIGLKKHYATHKSKMIGFKHSKESREKLSKSSMGKPRY
jgi:group I intron endonuclease